MVKNKNAFLGIGCFAFVLFVCTGVLCPYRSWAQADTTKAEQLKEVQIKARFNQLLHSPTPAQLVGGDELNRMNSLSVADAIRYFSGVQLKDYGGVGGLKTVNVRSMGSNHTAVFYDGIQLGNAQNGQVDLGRYSLDQVAEIALYSGQKSELLQPAKAFASASSLYLKTLVPAFKDKQSHYFRASVKGGSFGLIDPSLSYTQKINDNLAFSLSAELLNANGKYNFRYTNGVYDTTVVRHNADVFSKRIEGALYGKTLDSNEWQLKIYSYNSERGVPGAIVSNKFDFNQRQWDDNFFVQSSFQSSSTKRYQFLFNAKYAYDFTRYLDPTVVSEKGALDNRYAQQEAYFSFANQYQLNSFWSVSLSTDYSYQKLTANLTYFAYPVRNSALIAFASALKWNNFNLQANVLATFVKETVQHYLPAGNKAEYTPTVMASWQPFEKKELRIRAFYKSIFRLPTFNDLYYTFVGNTNLKPEYTNQYDIGFTYSRTYKNTKFTGFSLQADAYYNQVKDKIVAVPVADLFRWTMLNLDKVAIKGLELNFNSNWQFNQLQAKLKLNYTYEQALDQTKTSYSFRQQIPYIPLHSGSLVLNADYKSYGLNYSYIYTGERYSQKANIPINYIPAWYTHDVAVQKSFDSGRANYRLALEINNVFNQYYDVILNYPMPGRNFRLTLLANF